MEKDAQLLTSISTVQNLDLAPLNPWRRFVPAWLRSLIGVDSIDKYDAFLSYSWKSDSKVAPVVQSVIRKFLCPWYKFQAKSVFRDLSSLPAGSDLKAELCDRIDRSTHFIVLASPEAKDSQGMEVEASHWFTRPRNGQILILISSGDSRKWEEIRDHLLPPTLAKNLPAEPLWIPLQHRRERIISAPDDPQLRGELTEDLKQLLLRLYPGYDWEQLCGKERLQRQRARWLVSGVILLLLMLLGSVVYFWKSTEEQRRKARIQRLATQASQVAGDHNFKLGAALALESIWLSRKSNLASEADASEVLMSALMEQSPLTFSNRSLVASLVVLPDERLASGGRDGKIKVWPKDGTGKPKVLKHGHSEEDVSSLAVLPDGRLVSGGDDGMIKVWPQNGTGKPDVLKHGSRVAALAVMPDGRLASGGNDGKIKLWPKEGRGEPLVLSHHSWMGIASLAVLPDGRLVSGGDDGTIKVWPRSGKGKPVVLEHGPDNLPIMLTVIPDGRLVSSCLHCTIRFWSREWKSEREIEVPGIEKVSFLVALPDGRVASEYAGKITLWPKHEDDGEPVSFLSSSWGSMTSLAVLPDGRVVSGDGGGVISIWPKEEPIVLSTGDKNIQQLAVLPDGRLVGHIVGRIKIWPKDSMGEPLVFPFDRNFISSFVVLPDGRVASIGHYHTITLWPKDGKGEQVVLTHGSKVQFLVVLPDDRLASGSRDGTIKLWPKDGKGEPVVLNHGVEGMSSLVAFPDGRLVSGGDDGKINVWPKEGKGEPVVLAHGSKVQFLVVLPDDRLASGSRDGTIKLWPKDGKGEPVVLTHTSQAESSLPKGPDWGVSILVALPDGRLASGHDDGTVNLWLRDGIGKPVVLTHGREVSYLTMLPDGRLVSGSFDGGIKLWPKDGHGQPVSLPHVSESVWSMVALPDGRLAISGNGKIRLWLVDEQRLIAALCFRAGRNLTKDEWDHYVGGDRQPSCRDLPSKWHTID